MYISLYIIQDAQQPKANCVSLVSKEEKYTKRLPSTKGNQNTGLDITATAV